MKGQVEESVRESLNYSAMHDFEISDERAFSIYVAFFYFEKMARQSRHPVVLEFERLVFREANFHQFLTEEERLDLLVHIRDEKVGFEFKFPKKSDQQATKKRAEIYQAIGRLVYLTYIGFLDRGFLICATDNEAIYSSRRSNRFPTYHGYSIDEHSYILPSESPNDVISHPSYGRIWNCETHNLLNFQWRTVEGCSYRYLSPIGIGKET